MAEEEIPQEDDATQEHNPAPEENSAAGEEGLSPAPAAEAQQGGGAVDGEDLGVVEAMQAWEEGRHDDEDFEYEEEVLPVKFAQLDTEVPVRPSTTAEELNNVEVEISVELGRLDMSVKELLEVKEQKILELEKLAGESFDIRVNQRLFAEGEIVVLTEQMAVRITRLFDPLGNNNSDKD